MFKKFESEKTRWERLIGHKVHNEEQDMKMTQENISIATNDKNLMIYKCNQMNSKKMLKQELLKSQFFHNVSF